MHKLGEVYKTTVYYNSGKKRIWENCVLIESKGGSDLAGNMYSIAGRLVSDYGYKIYIVVRKDSRKKIESLLQGRVQLVLYGSARYYRLLARAKYLFNDSTFEYRFIKRKEQVYTNTWHGTPLKYMGKHVADRVYAMGNVQRNLAVADYLVFQGEHMLDKMGEAYELPLLFNGTKLLTGYPRNTVFFDKKHREELRQKLGFDGKQIIVYMPTWRGRLTDIKAAEQQEKLVAFLDELDGLLKDGQIFYVKLHLYVEKGMRFKDYKHIKSLPAETELYSFLNASDCLVTDYSSIMFDYADSGRNIILFADDDRDYKKMRGLYADIAELPFEKAHTARELSCALETHTDIPESFKTYFCTYDNAEADAGACSRVFEGSIRENKKEICAVYTENPCEYINNHFCDENTIICFKGDILKDKAKDAAAISKKAHIMPIDSGRFYTFKEGFALLLTKCAGREIMKRTLQMLKKREAERHFGGMNIKKVVDEKGNIIYEEY